MGDQLEADDESAATLAARRLLQIAGEAEARRVGETPEDSGELQEPKLNQLQLWPEPERGSPNAFLRSALFAAIQSEHRLKLEGPPPRKNAEPSGITVVTQKGITVSFRGTQLDQYDLDVWLQAIHWAMCQGFGEEKFCVFKGHAFLKEIGRTRGKENYELLTQSLERLNAGQVKIQQGTVTFTGHLVASFVRDDRTRVYKVSFSEEILDLFGFAAFTRLQWKERRALRGKALALWLHGFYSSHAQPFPLTVEYIQKLSGSRNTTKRSFKAKLKEAFKHLERVAGIKASFDGDTITVERTPTPAQTRHLEQQKRQQPQRRQRA